MIFLSKLFNLYDKLIYSFPDRAQIIVSLLLLFLIVWSLFSIFKHGHWIFVVLFTILLPSGWPALKNVVQIIVAIIKFLLIRIQVNI
jgi:hypothetical protein